MNSFNNVGKVNIIEGSGGGLLVLALNSDNPSSNPTKVCTSFCEIW